MTDFQPIKKTVPFNPILFNLTRLDIVATLNDEPPIPFAELRDVLGLTDGNLASHLKVLEQHDMIEKHKSFKSNKPHTTITLTIKGEEAFANLKQWFYEAFLE